MTFNTGARQDKPKEFSSGNVHSHPQNHDPNRMNFGGTGQNRSYHNRVSSVEGSSNSPFYSPYVDNTHYR